MAQENFAIIRENIEQGKPFEVRFEGDLPVVGEIKGISKIDLTKEELKNAKIKKSKGRKVAKSQKEFILEASRVFLQNRVGFKVTFATEESMIRFDLDHYIRLSRQKEERIPDKCTLVGFSSLDEKPIGFIKEQLSTYPSLTLKTPRR